MPPLWTILRATARYLMLLMVAIDASTCSERLLSAFHYVRWHRPIQKNVGLHEMYVGQANTS